jgi:flagellar biosynthesis anti-sigma factor FlgM
MRVEFSTPGQEPPESGRTGRAGQTDAGGVNAVSGAGSTSKSGGVDAPSTDEARFSFDHTRVQSLKAQVLAQPEVREAKVQTVQQAIGSGEYSIPPSQLAGALIGELGTA